MEHLKILLIDDDNDVLIVLRDMLSELGINFIFTATDAQEAEIFLKQTGEKIDLVICDWNMPRKTGLEFLKEIRLTNPTLPFIMISARADIDSYQRAKNEGVTTYLRKPFTLSHLDNKIRSIFKTPDLNEETA